MVFFHLDVYKKYISLVNSNVPIINKVYVKNIKYMTIADTQIQNVLREIG